MGQKNVLVTGSNGQLGNEIRVLSANFENLKFIFCDIDELDITSSEAVENFYAVNQVDFLINCAAYTAVDRAETDVENCFKVNSLAVSNLLNSCRKREIPILHISTDYVFNGKNYRPYNELDELNPKTVYGASKMEGEKQLSGYDKAIIIRTSWLYSSFGNNFVKTILKFANQNETIKVVFDQIGSPTYAADLANVILKITEQWAKTSKIVGGTFHFSNEGVCSWYDFAKAIVDYSKVSCKVLPVRSEEFPRPAPRPFYSVLDKTKIKSVYNIEIPYWQDSLKIMLNYLVKCH